MVIKCAILTGTFRGGAFLKKWMEYLEEHADLRYPDPAEALSEGS